MDPNLLSLGTSETLLYFKQQGITCIERLTRMTCFLLVLWFDITYTDKHTQGT